MTVARLLTDPVISCLLSLDASLRGAMIAAALSGMSPEEYWKRGGTACFTADFQMYAPIERQFFATLQDRLEKSSGLSERTVVYKVKHSALGDDPASIEITFMQTGKAVAISQDVYFDIDMLAMNRMGLYIHTSDSKILTRVPVPMAMLMQNCEDKMFAVVSDTDDDMILLNKMKEIHKMGFKLRQSKVHLRHDEIPSDKCPICQQEFEGGEKSILSTTCGHFFHCDCWKRHVEHSVRTGARQLPARFTFGSDSIFDQRSGSIFVHCPMCRDSHRAHEVMI